MSEIEQLAQELDRRDGAMRLFVSEEMKPVLQTLASLQERGSAPGDELVQDLESKLEELETTLASQHKSAEQFALEMKAQLALRDPGAPTPDGGKGKIENFFIDREGLRSALRHSAGRDGAPRGELHAVTSALFPAGQVPEEVMDSFIDNIVAETTTISMVDVLRQISGIRNIDELRVG